MTPLLRTAALTLAAAYVGCWAAGLIPWWLVVSYSTVLTVAWAESDLPRTPPNARL